MAEIWSNWAGDQRCAPERVERPRDAEELARVVRGARRLRAVGSGHSFTDIACTDGVLVDLGGMRRVLAVDGTDVTVEAGITLHDLGEELAAHGLALENQGDVDKPDPGRSGEHGHARHRHRASATCRPRWWA